jgi:hypothetical protein
MSTVALSPVGPREEPPLVPWLGYYMTWVRTSVLILFRRTAHCKTCPNPLLPIPGPCQFLLGGQSLPYLHLHRADAFIQMGRKVPWKIFRDFLLIRQQRAQVHQYSHRSIDDQRGLKVEECAASFYKIFVLFTREWRPSALGRQSVQPSLYWLQPLSHMATASWCRPRLN